MVLLPKIIALRYFGFFQIKKGLRCFQLIDALTVKKIDGESIRDLQKRVNLSL